MGLGGGSRFPFPVYMHNLDSLGAGDACYVDTNAGAYVSLVGLVIFDGWEVAASAASSLTAKVARGQGRRPRQATGGTTLMREMAVPREHATTVE